MELTTELKLEIVNGFDNVKSVEVTYYDNEFVSGFIQEINWNPELFVTICKHQAPRNQSPLHHLDFDRARKIVLIYLNGEVRIFE